MKSTNLKWTVVAVLSSAALYLGSLAVTAQQPAKPDPTAQKVDQVLEKLDALSKKVDGLAEKLDTVQQDVAFIKARGKG